MVFHGLGYPHHDLIISGKCLSVCPVRLPVCVSVCVSICLCECDKNIVTSVAQEIMHRIS